MSLGRGGLYYWIDEESGEKEVKFFELGRDLSTGRSWYSDFSKLGPTWISSDLDRESPRIAPLELNEWQD